MNNFDIDLITFNEDATIGKVNCKIWDKKYGKIMDKVRDFIKLHKEELLTTLNDTLYNEVYNKYCAGGISRWEMDSISYYNHNHELSNTNHYESGFSDFERMPEEPEVESTFTTRDGKNIPLYKIKRIAGTILDKDKNKKLLTILTTTGVVTIKVFGDAFIKYDKQISVKDEVTGKKKVIEKSMLSRGNIIIVTGIRRGDAFIAKKYKRTPYHLIEQIINIDENGEFETVTRE